MRGVSDLPLNSCQKKQENQAVFLKDSLENRLKTEENSSFVVDALPLTPQECFSTLQ